MITNTKKRYQITYSQLLNSLFFLSVLMSIIAAHTILDDMSKIVFILAVFILYYKSISKCLNLYFSLEIIFIIYSYWQIKSGNAVNTIVAMAKIKTLIICTIYYMGVFIYIVNSKSKEKSIEIFIKAIFYSLLICVFCNIDNVLAGRFGSNTIKGIKILGVTIGKLNATFIGHISGIGLFLGVMRYWKKDNKKLFMYTMFFSLIILISGTRKMLIMIVVSMIFIPFIYDNTHKFRRFMSRGIILLFLVAIAFVSMMKIPILYNSIGIRVQSIFEVMKTGQTTESSYNTRVRLIEKGMEAYEQRKNFGWGLDNFRYVINNGGYYSHNNFVEILVSSGRIGFIIYYLKYLYLISLTFIFKKNKKKEESNFIISLRVLIITLVFLEYWQVTYYYRLFMLPFIILLSLCNNKKLKHNVMKKEVINSEQ